MPRTTFSVALAAHLQSDAPTIALLVKMIRRDGVILGLTARDADIAFGGLNYKAMDGVKATAMQEALGSSINGLEVVGLLSDDRISEGDIRAGKYDGCEIWGYAVNYNDLSMGSGVLFRCYIGKIDIIDGKFVASVEDLMQKLAQQIGNVTSETCRYRNFGDSHCDQQGTAIAIATKRHGPYALQTLSADRKTLTFNVTLAGTLLFDQGRCLCGSGLNAGINMQIKSFTIGGSTVSVTLYGPFPYAALVGDTFTIEEGCDRTFVRCKHYNNSAAFGGFTNVPGGQAYSKTGRG